MRWVRVPSTFSARNFRLLWLTEPLPTIALIVLCIFSSPICKFQHSKVLLLLSKVTQKHFWRVHPSKMRPVNRFCVLRRLSEGWACAGGTHACEPTEPAGETKEPPLKRHSLHTPLNFIRCQSVTMVTMFFTACCSQKHWHLWHRLSRRLLGFFPKWNLSSVVCAAVLITDTVITKQPACVDTEP